jgi:hypothetical protein
MNKADSSRMQLIKESGCIATLLAAGKSQAPDVHHLLSCGRRKGHQFTIGLSPWHHRGVQLDGFSRQEMMGIYGPSYAHSRRGFQAFFGRDDLLLKIQNVILQHYDESPWHDYCVPTLVKREAQQLWSER